MSNPQDTNLDPLSQRHLFTEAEMSEYEIRPEDTEGFVASRMRFEAQRRSAEESRLDAIGHGIAGSSFVEPSPEPPAFDVHSQHVVLDYDLTGALAEALRELYEEDEAQKVDTDKIEVAVRMILEATGQDLSREDLRETPARVARFYREFFSYQPGTLATSFATEAVCDQMVTVSGVRVWSMCAHHMLPFYTDISMGYIAEKKVLGLSKFARIAHAVAHSLQTQEHIAEQIADKIMEVIGTRNVAVLCENGMHTCMTMRGIRTPGSMNNAVMRGVFRLRPTARTEFYNLIQRSRND
jgi:GTP cyclohydrolase I